jgi:hypothetical protein
MPKGIATRLGLQLIAPTERTIREITMRCPRIALFFTGSARYNNRNEGHCGISMG